MTETKIDFVVMWVDDTDPEWRLEKEKITGVNIGKEEHSRLYRDYGTFNHWFRMVEKNAPWVNNVFLITFGHLPTWLNTNHPKLKIVKHEDFIPKKYLPTFNAAVIEMNLHRIEELSENFVLFNDDMYLLKPISPKDYFIDGKPKLPAVYNTIVPFESFSRLIFNDVEVINRHFHSKKSLKRSPFKFFNLKYGMYNLRNLFLLPWGISGYVNFHLPNPLKKSTMSLIWEKEYAAMNQSCSSHLRNYQTDINQWLVNYWHIETNQFEPSSTKFGKYITLNNVNQIESIIKNRNTKVVCINDSEDADIANFDILKKTFDSYFPEKSSFEL